MTSTPVRLTPNLVPTRDDIQGAIEFAYGLLLHDRASHMGQPSTDSLEALGATILGPALWIAKHHNCPQVFTWLIESLDSCLLYTSPSPRD